jgi:hypothetical protein
MRPRLLLALIVVAHSLGILYFAGVLAYSGVSAFSVGLLAVWTGISAWSVVVNWQAMRSSERKARGCCAQCGYDLRASPDRCPECGAHASQADVI